MPHIWRRSTNFTAKNFTLTFMTKKTLAIVGCGKLGGIVADAVASGILAEYELIGLYSRTRDKA